MQSCFCCDSQNANIQKISIVLPTIRNLCLKTYSFSSDIGLYHSQIHNLLIFNVSYTSRDLWVQMVKEKANKWTDKQGSVSFSNMGFLKVTVFIAGHLVDPHGKNAQLCGREAVFPGTQIRTGSESHYFRGGRAVDFLNSNKLLCILISHFLGEMVGWALLDMIIWKPE